MLFACLLWRMGMGCWAHASGVNLSENTEIDCHEDILRGLVGRLRESRKKPEPKLDKPQLWTVTPEVYMPKLLQVSEAGLSMTAVCELEWGIQATIGYHGWRTRGRCGLHPRGHSCGQAVDHCPHLPGNLCNLALPRDPQPEANSSREAYNLS